MKIHQHRRARAVEADDERGACDQLFEKPGEDDVAGDLSETNVELARQPDGLGSVAARLCLRAGAKATTKLVERFPICAGGGRKHDGALDGAASLEHVPRFA